MSAYVFVWNPNCLSVSEQDYLEDLKSLHNLGEHQISWSIWDYQNVKKGDKAYLYKTGTLNSGICGCGTIISKVFEEEHWKYDELKCHYVGINVEYLFDIEKMPYISSAFLKRNFPKHKWLGGHSGMMLIKEYENELNAIFENYLSANKKYIDGLHGASSWERILL